MNIPIKNAKEIDKMRHAEWVMPIDLIEFPADDLARARQFWEGLLGLALDGRSASEGQGLLSHTDGPAFGVSPEIPQQRRFVESWPAHTAASDRRDST